MPLLIARSNGTRHLRTALLLLLLIVTRTAVFRAGVARADGGTCRPRVGETHADVLSECGTPYARTEIPKGPCSPEVNDQFLAVCGNTCEVYASKAICFGGDNVVGVEELDLPTHSGLLQPCHW